MQQKVCLQIKHDNGLKKKKKGKGGGGYICESAKELSFLLPSAPELLKAGISAINANEERKGGGKKCVEYLLILFFSFFLRIEHYAEVFTPRDLLSLLF